MFVNAQLDVEDHSNYKIHVIIELNSSLQHAPRHALQPIFQIMPSEVLVKVC